MKHELLALVKFNNGKAFVLKEEINMTYKRYGNLLIGIDQFGVFVDVLYYERPCKGFEAFGGREFDITLDNGEVIHCKGQWWSGGSKEAAEILGEDLISATYNDIESLKKCYVYTGHCAIKRKLEELAATYEGEFYEYYEYEKKLREGKDAG